MEIAVSPFGARYIGIWTLAPIAKLEGKCVMTVFGKADFVRSKLKFNMQVYDHKYLLGKTQENIYRIN